MDDVGDVVIAGGDGDDDRAVSVGGDRDDLCTIVDDGVGDVVQEDGDGGGDDDWLTVHSSKKQRRPRGVRRLCVPHPPLLSPLPPTLTPFRPTDTTKFTTF